MASISRRLRQAVVERACGRCEYCLTLQAIVVEMEVDHVQPESAGDRTEPSNLCLACVGCNAFKLAFQTSPDPETAEETRLFNPRADRWEIHFRWDDNGSRVVGITAVGRATVTRLRMNRPRMIEARRLWVQAGWHPPAVLRTTEAD